MPNVVTRAQVRKKQHHDIKHAVNGIKYHATLLPPKSIVRYVEGARKKQLYIPYLILISTETNLYHIAKGAPCE